MLFFHIRAWLEAQYICWKNENKLKNSPMTLISFLMFKGYINETKVIEDYKKGVDNEAAGN